MTDINTRIKNLLAAEQQKSKAMDNELAKKDQQIADLQKQLDDASQNQLTDDTVAQVAAEEQRIGIVGAQTA